MIALTIQLMIEPARRSYDDATRERLVELFGAPERWAVTTRSLVWAKLDVLVPAFTGTTTVTVPIACHYDLELAAAKYLRLAPRRPGAAGAALQRDDLLPRRGRRPADGADPVVEVDRLPDAGVGVAGDDRALLPRDGLDRRPLRDVRGAPAARSSSAASPRSTRASPSCWTTAMTDRLEELVDVAAVGGVRAVPVHPGRDQERHPHPVRDRLPAGLRGRVSGRVRPRAARVRGRPRRRAPRRRRCTATLRYLAPSGERHRGRRAPGRARAGAGRRTRDHASSTAGG